MTDVSTVEADLILVVSEGSVQGGQLSELIPLVVVLGLRRRGGLCDKIRRKTQSARCDKSRREKQRDTATYGCDDRVDEVDARSDFLWVVGGDETVQVLVRVRALVLGSTLSLLDGSLSSDRDLCATLALHRLERVSSRADEETEEVDLWELLDGDVHLVGRLGVSLLGVVLGRRAEGGVELERLVDQLDALVLELASVSDLARVCSSSVSVVRRGRGGRSRSGKKRQGGQAMRRERRGV